MASHGASVSRLGGLGWDSAWKKDPAEGLIGVQVDPPRHFSSHALDRSGSGSQPGMLIVETIAKIRRLFRNEHKSIREISRELRLSRKVVRKALRSDRTAFAYKRKHQPRPQLDSHVARLDVLLAE